MVFRSPASRRSGRGSKNHWFSYKTVLILRSMFFRSPASRRPGRGSINHRFSIKILSILIKNRFRSPASRQNPRFGKAFCPEPGFPSSRAQKYYLPWEKTLPKPAFRRMYYCFYIVFFSRHIRKRIRFTMFSWGRRAETRVSARAPGPEPGFPS